MASIQAFMELKEQYDSLSQAIKLSKASDVDEKYVKDLISRKSSLKDKYLTASEYLVRRMPLGINILTLGEGWYGIRHLSDKHELALKTEMLIERDLYIIERDGTVRAELTRAQLDQLLPGIVDLEALEVYKQKLQRNAVDMIHDIYGIHLDVSSDMADEQSDRTFISHHAGWRWVQRKMGIPSETQATEYKRNNIAEVEAAILEAFATAEKLWVAEDGIEYWFDADNLMYVVGNTPNRTIITLYESDFTFSKHINRHIVLEQVGVIQSAHDHLADMEQCHNDLSDAVEQRIRDTADQIRVMEAEIALLNSARMTVMAEREESARVVGRARVRYNAECNKLFKKFDM